MVLGVVAAGSLHLALALRAVAHASTLSQAVRAQWGLAAEAVVSKDDLSPVTVADFGVQAIAVITTLVSTLTIALTSRLLTKRKHRTTRAP